MVTKNESVMPVHRHHDINRLNRPIIFNKPLKILIQIHYLKTKNIKKNQRKIIITTCIHIVFMVIANHEYIFNMSQ